MKRVLMYRWKAYNYLDIKKYLESKGYEVDEIYQYLESYDVAEDFAEILFEKIKEKEYEFVFTINYFPVISNVCRECNIFYVSWSCDNPLISMYHESIYNENNIVFLFDYVSYHEFKEMGVKNIFYLPLCVDTKRIEYILKTAKDLSLYKNEISFVGSLYERNTYDKIESELSDYMRGYLECYIELQAAIPEQYFIEKALTVDMLAMLYEKFNLNKSEESFSDLNLVFSTTVLGFKVAREQRITAINMLSNYFDVGVYSNSDTSVLPKASYKGGVDYWTEMPKVFNGSKINLNFTIPNIKTGIPLRVWDVMGSGGFLITNKQAEMDLFFKEDEDIVTFGSYEELKEKSQYYINHESERDRISKGALNKVRMFHTYDVRMGEMFEMLEGLIN